MKKTTRVIALFVGFALTAASAARAQAPAPESKMFGSVNIGANVQSHTFSDSTSFTLFNETATVSANQTVGRGFLFDIGAGYRLGPHFAVAAGVWTTRAKGESAATADLPDPTQFGKPKTVIATASDLKQTAIGLNLQFIWTTAIADKIDLSIFAGPTILHVSQDIGTITVVPNTQNASATVVTESKTSGKAGNVGIDVSYKLTDRYGAGIFVRYAGGQVDLPSAQKVKAGGIQLGIGARIQF